MPPAPHTPTVLPTSFSIWLWVGGLLWFIVVGWVAFSSDIPGSPDEAANAYFIKRLSQSGQLSVDQSSNQLSPSQLSYWHPRSVLVDGHQLKPGSFVGWPLLSGGLERLTFDKAHRLVMPMLALIGLLALYRILRRFWSQSWSLVGAGLTAVHPAWVQFQTLPDYHNGAFASLLVVAGWRLMKLWDEGSWRNAVWFGLAYGTTLFFRPVEALWTAPLIGIVLLAQRNWRALGLAMVVTLVVQLPWLLANRDLYGTWLSSGYAPDGVSSLLSNSTTSGLETPQFITPPGGWTWNWLHSFWHYLVLLVPAWSAASAVALVFYLRRIADRPLKVFKIGLVILPLVFVAVYYGSWDLYPLETPETIGSLSSYARYWLPLYVPMVVGVLWLLKRIQTHRLVFALAVSGLFVSQIATIIWHPNAGVLDRLDDNRLARTKREMVFKQTPATAAVVAGHMDKILFPDRIVSFGLPIDDTEWAAFKSVATERPVYIYVTPRQYRLETLNRQLQPLGLTIGQRQAVGSDELWEVTRI